VEAGVAGDRIATLVDLPSDSCAVFIARATEGVEDLDLSAFGEDGAILGMDEGADKTPALLICPPHPARVYISARIASGQGLVAVGVERMPPKDAERAAGAYHARHSQADLDSRLAAWPGLVERIAEHRKRLGGQWQDVRRVAVPLDARIPTRISATVEENRCLNALVLTSEELSRLELSVQDENGQILGRAAALGRDRSLVVCSPLASSLSFELRPQGGRGVAVLVLSQTAPGTSNDIDDAWRLERYAAGTLADARQKTAARLEGLGYPNAKVLKTGALQPGRLDSESFALPKGCARLDILAAAPVRDLSAHLWSDDDSLIAESEPRASPVLFACSGGGRARLDTESLSQPGEYSVEMRVEPEIPPLLTSSPLAAGRLLTRMLEHGLIRSGAQAGKVTHHELSPEHLEHADLVIPAGRCSEVTLALGAGSTGAELRLLNIESGEELALVRGTVVASARACASGVNGGGTLRARAEFRVAAGHGEALSTSHLSTPSR
jgi:rhodanese-related sulfurtransferase